MILQIKTMLRPHCNISNQYSNILDGYLRKSAYEEEGEEGGEPTVLLDSAAARLVKRNRRVSPPFYYYTYNLC